MTTNIIKNKPQAPHGIRYGFDEPYYDSGYWRPFSRCECGTTRSCGNSHHPNVTGVEQLGVKPSYYLNPASVPFRAWSGSLVAADMNPNKPKNYVPPALPYGNCNVMCERPQGQQNCAKVTGNPCPP